MWCVFVCVWNSHHVTGPDFHTAPAALAKDEHSDLLLFFQFIGKWPISFKSYSLLPDWKTERWHDWKNSPQSWESRLKWDMYGWHSFSDRRNTGPLWKEHWTPHTPPAGGVNGAMKWTIPLFSQSFWILPRGVTLRHTRFFMWTQIALSPLTTAGT